MKLFAARMAYTTTAVMLLIPLVTLAAIKGPMLFTDLDNLAAGCAVAAPLILATMALTPVAVGLPGGIDLGVGPLMSLINCALVVWFIEAGVTQPVTILALAILLGLAAGLAQGSIVATLRVQPIIVSLGAFLVFSAFALMVLDQPSGTVPQWLADLAYRTGPVPNAAIVVLAACLVWWPVSRSTFYRNIRLAGGGEAAAFTAGVNTTAARLGAYALGGFFAGLAALMLTAQLASGDPTQGTAYTLQTIAALALGGTSLAGGRGGMVGSVIGAIDVYFINYVIATFDFGEVSSYVTQAAYGVTLLVSLAFGIVATRYVQRFAWGRGDA
jgi:ribose transport system permease protein